MRLLVTGGLGLLGIEIARIFEGSAEIRSTDREELDVTDPAACRREVDGFRPDVVIHCAAYTAVDRAESDAAFANLLNVEGTRNVARVCRERRALMVTFGTDYIFDGTSSRPYREEDPANPLSVYGKTKWAAEQALREEGGDHLLVRTQWMFGPAGKNFIRTILEEGAAGGHASRRVGPGRVPDVFEGSGRRRPATAGGGRAGDGPLLRRRGDELVRSRPVCAAAVRSADGGAARGENTGLAVPGAKAGVRRVEQGEVSRDHRDLPAAVGGSGGGVP